jgi:hypothetical protein
MQWHCLLLAAGATRRRSPAMAAHAERFYLFPFTFFLYLDSKKPDAVKTASGFFQE